MRNRALTLKREALAELTATDLGSVAFGAYELTHVTCPLTDACTTGPSFERCPTLPVNYCTSILGADSIPCRTR